MRRRHLEALRPLCPVCRSAEHTSPLALATVVEEVGDDVLEGVLRCAHAACQHEFPIVDAIPILMPQLRAFIGGSAHQILARQDLSATLESLLGDACGPDSPFEITRQHLSSYTWDHWGDLDPREAETVPRPGAVVELLERALELAGEPPAGPRLDIGCAVGRASCALAGAGEDLVLGVDANFALLQTGSRVLRQGIVRYPRRRVGLVYDRREFRIEVRGARRVDLWACDAATLPFAEGSFAVVAGLNLIDCVASPLAALSSAARLLMPGGKLLLATPYDWTPGATPVEAWIGGHSQRGDDAGAAEPVLRRLLTPGAHPASVPDLEILAEEPSLPWRVRLHERSVVEYQLHLLVAQRSVPSP